MEVTQQNRAAWVRFVDMYGWDALLAMLNIMCNGLDLYSVSQDWHAGGYLLKAKGARGDLLVRFN